MHSHVLSAKTRKNAHVMHVIRTLPVEFCIVLHTQANLRIVLFYACVLYSVLFFRRYPSNLVNNFGGDETGGACEATFRAIESSFASSAYRPRCALSLAFAAAPAAGGAVFVAKLDRERLVF